MMLTILGFVVIIVATYFAYKTAKESGRSAALWTVVTFTAGFGIQFGMPFLFGLALAIIWLASGGSQAELYEAAHGAGLIIGLICLFLSLVAMALILRHLSRLPEEQAFVPPPSPPAFD